MVVDFKVIDDENEADDDTVPLQKSTEDKVLSTPTTNRVVIFMELVKVFLLFVICIILGLLQSQKVPLGDPMILTQLPVLSTNWEYKLVTWDSTYVEDCQATTTQWNYLEKVNSGSGIGGLSSDQCYCGDPLKMCNAEIGSDVINPNIQESSIGDRNREFRFRGDDARRFGLVPPRTPCNTCVPGGRHGFNESKSSFVNTALKEGLTQNEMFTECDYPTLTRTIKKYGKCYSDGSCGWGDLTEEQYGASHYGFTPVKITIGNSLDSVKKEVVSCVMEKLVNRIAEGGWEFIPSPTVDTLYFRRQKV